MFCDASHWLFRRNLHRFIFLSFKPVLERHGVRGYRYVSLRTILDWIHVRNWYVRRYLVPVGILLEWFYVRCVLLRSYILPLRSDVEWVILCKPNQYPDHDVMSLRPVLERKRMCELDVGHNLPLRPVLVRAAFRWSRILHIIWRRRNVYWRFVHERANRSPRDGVSLHV